MVFEQFDNRIIEPDGQPRLDSQADLLIDRPQHLGDGRMVGLSQQVPQGVLGAGRCESAAGPGRGQRRDLGGRVDCPADQAGSDCVPEVVPAAVRSIARIAEAGSHWRTLAVADARRCLHGHKDRILDRDFSTGDAKRFLQRDLQMGQHDPFDRTRRCHHVGLASATLRNSDCLMMPSAALRNCLPEAKNRLRYIDRVRFEAHSRGPCWRGLQLSRPYHTTPGISAGWNQAKIAAAGPG